jgi:membrane fusion protein (multidrug efflux system)
MKVSPILAALLATLSLSLPACNPHKEEEQSHEERHTIVVTNPLAKDVVITQQYVCQIRSRRHINVKALQGGYLEEIQIKEGQAVKEKDVLFKIVPTLYEARLDAEKAEVRLADLEFKNSQRLNNDPLTVVSKMEVSLYEAKLAKAEAKRKLAEAELNFATIKAPFDGIVDRLYEMQGSLIKEGDVLTTLSDNAVMWVYFNMPEARYLEDMANPGQDMDPSQVELVLADGSKFPHACTKITREAKFNNETGNIPYRADFPNPNRLLRHGQTGNILIHRTLKKALVIPQRATFEILDKQYVWVVGEDHAVHQREIVVQNEKDDIFVVKKTELATGGRDRADHKPGEHAAGEHNKADEHNGGEHTVGEHRKGIKGLEAGDKIIFEGVRQVHEGMKVEYEYLEPEKALANMKFHAE